MDLIQIFLYCVLLGLIFYLTKKYFTRPSQQLPGPMPLPLIGNLHLVGENAHETLSDMSKKYGPIYRIYFGNLRMIVISDFSAVKEVLIKRGTEFAGRSSSLLRDLMSHGRKDILLSDHGKGWQFHRKVAHSALRMFGEGRKKMEGIIIYEIGDLCKRFEESENVIFDPAADIDLIITNIIHKMVVGSTFQREDPKFIKFKTSLRLINEKIRNDMFDLIPFLQWFPWKNYKTIQAIMKEMDEYILNKLKMERSNMRSHVFGQDIKVTNYIQTLLKAKQEAEEEDNDLQQYLTEDHLIATIFDLFLAGAETTSTVIKWCLLYVVNWPEIQEKIQMELDGEVGKPNGVNFIPLSLKPAFPYLEAVIMETQRLASIVPLGLFHKAMNDTTLSGYDIPKGTVIVINHWAIHHDESYWKNPFHFDPTRFLDTNGKIVQDSSRQFIPFGAGTRGCFGQTLARTELFLCLCNLFHRFHFTFPSAEEVPNLRGKSKVTLCPRPYRIIAKKRY